MHGVMHARRTGGLAIRSVRSVLSQRPSVARSEFRGVLDAGGALGFSVQPKRVYSAPRSRPDGEEEKGLWETANETWEKWQGFNQLVDEGIVSRDASLPSRLLMFWQLETSTAFDGIDFKAFIDGAKMAFRVVNEIVTSRDFAVHAIRETAPDWERADELTEQVLGAAPASSENLERLREMVSRRVFDVMAQAVFGSVLLQRTYFQLEGVDVLDCSLSSVHAVPFPDAATRKSYFQLHGFEPALEQEDAESPVSDAAGASGRKDTEDETWAVINVKLTVEEKMRIIQVSEEDGSQETNTARTYESVWTFLGCVHGPQKLQWRIVDVA